MSNEFTMTTGQAHEVAQAFGRNGWNNEQVKKMSEGDFLKQVLDVLLGRAKIKLMEHTVDLSADFFLPNTLQVEEHQKGKVAKLERKGDDLYIDGKKIGFWLSGEQKNGVITGNILRVKLKDKLVLNANLAEYLLKNSHLIPETWKKDENGKTRYIFFWGTIYRNFVRGGPYVRCIYWHGSGWGWHYYGLSECWHSSSPALLLAS